jgi:hypothetical protein
VVNNIAYLAQDVIADCALALGRGQQDDPSYQRASVDQNVVYIIRRAHGRSACGRERVIHNRHIEVSGFAPPPLYCGDLLAAALFSYRHRQILKKTLRRGGEFVRATFAAGRSGH